MVDATIKTMHKKWGNQPTIQAFQRISAHPASSNSFLVFSTCCRRSCQKWRIKIPNLWPWKKSKIWCSNGKISMGKSWWETALESRGFFSSDTPFSDPDLVQRKIKNRNHIYIYIYIDYIYILIIYIYLGRKNTDSYIESPLEMVKGWFPKIWETRTRRY